MRNILACIILLPGTAAAGLVTDAPAGVNEPKFYEDLRSALAGLAKSKEPIIRELFEVAQKAPAKIYFRPMTDDRSTWNNDGTPDRAHTEPNDKRPKREGRDKPADATVFMPRDSVERGKP
jgi:hypothetical protein